MASSAAREAGIAILMRPWAEEAEVPARPAAPTTPAQRFWRALAQFIFDYNRY
ncbi:MAG TPA: hypothetical protein VGL23_13440 [Chloroflexota bacterium]